MREYPDYFYIQSAVIPFRTDRGRLEILLISSRGGKRWIVPKGIVEFNYTPADSAVKEAMEEAGVAGEASQASLGVYEYEKWGDVCTVEVFAMRVEQIFNRWMENERAREWVSLKKARRKIGEKALRKMLKRLPEFIEENDL